MDFAECQETGSYFDTQYYYFGRQIRARYFNCNDSIQHFSLINPTLSADVDGDGCVSATDANLIINEVSRNGGGSRSVLDYYRGEAEYKYDANGDFKISSSDALFAINKIGSGICN